MAVTVNAVAIACSASGEEDYLRPSRRLDQAAIQKSSIAHKR
jgi:hypothetical protein